jgi:ATP-dependent DNA helicase DinG
MLCDRRLTTRSYGKVFLDSLPPMPRTEDVNKVCQFLQHHLEAVQADPASLDTGAMS